MRTDIDLWTPPTNQEWGTGTFRVTVEPEEPPRPTATETAANFLDACTMIAALPHGFELFGVFFSMVVGVGTELINGPADGCKAFIVSILLVTIVEVVKVYREGRERYG